MHSLATVRMTQLRALRMRRQHTRMPSLAHLSFTAFRWTGAANLLYFLYFLTSAYAMKATSACVIGVSISSGELFVALSTIMPLWGRPYTVNRSLITTIVERSFPFLLSRTAGSDDVPIAAELYSGTFVIYSTKEYVGSLHYLHFVPTPLYTRAGRLIHGENDSFNASFDIGYSLPSLDSRVYRHPLH